MKKPGIQLLDEKDSVVVDTATDIHEGCIVSLRNRVQEMYLSSCQRRRPEQVIFPDLRRER
jgi:hypothetical protein